MILGDNIFHGNGLTSLLEEAAPSARSRGRASVFAYSVGEPRRFGVVEFGPGDVPLSIEEKPARPKEQLTPSPGCTSTITPESAELAGGLVPSPRGELEITDLNNIYLERGLLDVQKMGRGYVWLDTGSFEALADAGEFVRLLYERQGIDICSPEEIAFGRGWVDADRLLQESGSLRPLAVRRVGSGRHSRGKGESEMSTMLVTGGAGFIGSDFIEYELRNAGSD
jgi:glucose-1-phosphate thymidylyltransferase